MCSGQPGQRKTRRVAPHNELQWEIDETMQRFEKILAAMSREHDPDAQARIEAAAKAHYAKLERLQALLDEAQAKPKAVPAGSV